MTPPLVKRFLIALNEHKLLNIVLFSLIIGASVVLALRPKPEQPQVTYRALGTLSFRNPPPIFTATGEQVQIQGRSLISQELLLSPQVLEAVRDSLDIDNNQLAAIVRQLKVSLPSTANLPPGSPQQEQLISLEYNGTVDSVQSRFILRVFMEEMVNYSRWLNGYQLRERINALDERLEVVQNDLTEAEELFYRYISTDGSALLALEDGSLFNGITSAQTQQRQIRLFLEQINAQIDSIVKQLGLTPEQAYTSSVLSADPIIATLRAQILEIEAGIEQLQNELRPEHPTMVELYNQQQATERLLQQRAEELIGDDGVLTSLPENIRKESNLDLARQELANQLVALQTQKEGLTSQLVALEELEQQLRQEYEASPDKQLQQARLVQTVESQRILYQTILAALTDAKAAEAETVSSLVIAQEPYVPRAIPTLELPTNPLLILGGGVVLGGLAVSGLTFLLATLDDRLHTAQELRETLGSADLPVLGQIPAIANQPGEISHSVLKNPDSPYVAFYERVRSNIRRFGTESYKLILVTSINRFEGKTVTAYNLAIASAQAGKRTLLVEADLRSSSLASVFDLTVSPEAKTEPLRYYSSRGDCINLVPEQENLYLLPSTGPQKQAVSIIESNELQRLLRDARGRFDLVIIDTPSLATCNDALLLESLIDAVVLVTRPGITQKSLLNETIEQFSEGELPLLGAVINSVDDLSPLTEVPPEEFNRFEAPRTVVVSTTGDNS
ncbi:MAG: polysaccharide biosynthesis tyrosine autokinase [Gloeocapsa sp. DLM2.Bin57]|nr:MAG: polysaccharide biosynthesis tyrosine autokinase [Gloeocapsa sp. DLM2.Bin57]